MNCAPLNLAHFHERRAEKLLKRHNYDEATKAIETSLFYVQECKNKNVQISKALDVLNTQKWEYDRKLQQIQIRKQQYERLKLKEIVPAVQNENPINIKTEMANAQSIARSIDKTIKDFNDKYGSTSLLINMQPTNDNKDTNVDTTCKQDEMKEDRLESDTCKRRLSILDEHLQAELPSLVPLELPSFDYSVFASSGLVENFQK